MKLSVKLIPLPIILLYAFVMNAQQRDIQKADHKTKHEIASNLVDKGSYYNAIEHLTELVKENPKNKKYTNKLAEAYFMSRDYANAEIWYLKAVELDGKITTSSLYKLAETQKYNGKYAEAKTNFQIFFESKYRDNRGEKYKLFAENEITSCEFAISHLNDSVKTKVKHLGDTINSAYTDFSPSLINDTTLVFASLQADSVLTYDHDAVHFNHTKLYTSQLNGEEWSHPQELNAVNSIFENNANGSLSSDGKRFYFSRCYETLSHKMICHIYVSDIDEKGRFGKPKKLPNNVNKGGFNNTQPVVAKHYLDNGQQIEVLYFSSNRNGGKGGFDIWYSEILPKNKYKNPINLGKEINSIRDEITPFYDSLSGNLYFSSNYHFGFGGYDIFRAKGQTISWTSPQNILTPYNSNVDDTYYILNKRQNKGFFVSNRVGGINLKSATCCDDIYGYTQEKTPLIISYTYDKETTQLHKTALETVYDISNEKQNDSIKQYEDIEGKYLYNKLTANEIFKLKKSGHYNLVSIDSGKVLENITFIVNENGEISNPKLSNIKDSISISKVEDYRFDITSINIFIHKESKRKPVDSNNSPVSNLKNINTDIAKSKDSLIVSNNIDTIRTTKIEKDTILNGNQFAKIETKTQNDSSFVSKKPTEITKKEIVKTQNTRDSAVLNSNKSNILNTKDTTSKEIVKVPKINERTSSIPNKIISVKTTDNTKKEIVKSPKIDDSTFSEPNKRNSDYNAVKSPKVILTKNDTVLISKKSPPKETKQIKEYVTTEKSVTKINRLKNVKRAIVINNVASESEVISNSTKTDSVISYIKTTETVYTDLGKVPDIKMVVQFGYNEDQFILEHKKMLDSIADFLIKNPHVIMNVEAHTDNVGSEQYNIDLSYKRAKAIIRYFSHLGISRERLIPKWHGENRPLLPNQNADGTDNEHHRHVNRRAELKFYNVKKKVKK